MASWMKSGVCAATIALAATSLAAQEQSSTNRVDVKTDWNVFAEPPASPTECWGVAVPEETVNTDASGRIKSVRRGDILLFITYRPGGGSVGQVSFTGGYPFAENSFVTMDIGDASFNLFTDGEWAWTTSEDEDAKVIAAMKRGAKAVLTARSARGTITKDTFSLLGFTAATESAAKFCNG